MLRPGRVERKAAARWIFLLVPVLVLLFVFSSSGGRDDSNIIAVKSQEVGKSGDAAKEQKEKPANLTPAPPLPTRQVMKKTTKSCNTNTTPQFRLSDDGRKCILPFRVQDAWHDSCAIGLCAVRIDPLSRASELANCTDRGYQGGKLSCVTTKNSGRCSDRSQVSASTCEAIIGGRNSFGVCVCRTETGETVTSTVDCEERIETTCNDICRKIQDDVTSSSYSASMVNEVPEVIFTLAQLATSNKPADIDGWKQYSAALPDIDQLPTKWCGRGIAIMAGSVNTLPQALATVSFIRGHLHSTIPVEIWQTDDEKTELSQEFRRALNQLSVVIRTLPEEAKPASASEMFALKPAVVLASSFDEVLLLDADTVPIVDPDHLLSMRPPKSSAVFWPDYWTLLWDAKIFESIGGWPYGDNIYVPSQDSGLMVVCKSCGAWKPLALAFYFNFYNNIYYPAIYIGHFQEKRCRGGECIQGHDVPGAGDKDTFQIAWMALKETFLMMPPASIGGTMLPKRRLVCGSSFIHRNLNRDGVAIHHNSNKWWWKDFAAGRWTSWHTGFLLTHVTSFQNDSAAYFADGMNDWRSITYSTRYDAGRQQPPVSSRWCIVYKGSIQTMKIVDDIGYDIEKVLVEFYTKLYSAPWMMEWATLHSGGTQLLSCVKQSGWESSKWLETASDEDLRNTVIAHLTDLGKGNVPYLQSHSDFSLSRLCQQVLALPKSPKLSEKTDDST